MSDNCSGCEGQYAVLKGRTQSTWPRLLCIFAEDPNDCIAIFFVRSVPNPDSEVQSQGSGGRLEQAPGEQARAVAERKPGHLGHPLFQVVAERPARHARQQQRPPAVPLLVAKPLQVRRQHLRPIIRLLQQHSQRATTAGHRPRGRTVSVLIRGSNTPQTFVYEHGCAPARRSEAAAVSRQGAARLCRRAARARASAGGPVASGGSAGEGGRDRCGAGADREEEGDAHDRAHHDEEGEVERHPPAGPAGHCFLKSGAGLPTGMIAGPAERSKPWASKTLQGIGTGLCLT